MHDISTKFQASECNIVIFMHVPRYAPDVPHHAVDTLATAGQNSLSLWHILLFSWDLSDLKSYCLLEFHKQPRNSNKQKLFKSGRSQEKRRVCQSDREFCLAVASVLTAWWRTSRAYLGTCIKMTMLNSET